MRKLIALGIVAVSLWIAAPPTASILPPGWPYSQNPCVRAVLAHGGTLAHALDVCNYRPIAWRG
jgi:hypothetical protein